MSAIHTREHYGILPTFLYESVGLAPSFLARTGSRRCAITPRQLPINVFVGFV